MTYQQVHPLLSIGIDKVIEIIPLKGIDSIVQSATFGTLSSPRKVTF